MDRNDARGIAQMMRAKIYRSVHVRTLRSQKLQQPNIRAEGLNQICFPILASPPAFLARQAHHFGMIFAKLKPAIAQNAPR
jgi:hypothetical protein